MTTIDTLNKTTIYFGNTFNSSSEIKKEIISILKIYQECNKNLSEEVFNLRTKKIVQVHCMFFELGSNIKIKTLESAFFDSVRDTIEIWKHKTYERFWNVAFKHDWFFEKVLNEFKSRSEDEMDVEKLEKLDEFEKMEKNYNETELRYEPPLKYGEDIAIDIPSLVWPLLSSIFCYSTLTKDDAKWLDGKTIQFPDKEVEIKMLDGEVLKIPKQNSTLKMQVKHVEIKKRFIVATEGATENQLLSRARVLYSGSDDDKKIAQKIKQDFISSVPFSISEDKEYTMIKFEEIKIPETKIFRNQKLIFDSFKTYINNQTNTIRNVFKLIESYNEMIKREKEIAKEILQEKQKASSITESNPNLPVTYADELLYKSYLSLLGINNSKITWDEALECCGRLGYTITHCGGSIVKFEYRNQLMALIPEKELEKFIEEIDREDVKVSKNIHLSPGLLNRFKRLLEETGFTIYNVLLNKEKTINL